MNIHLYTKTVSSKQPVSQCFFYRLSRERGMEMKRAHEKRILHTTYSARTFHFARCSIND